MSRTGCRLATIVLVGALVMGVSSVRASAAATPGYDRIVVKSAGISMRIPDTWEVVETTRKEAKETLRNNPDLVKEGATVETLLRWAFQARWDADGDGYPDRFAVVQSFPGAGALPSPSEMRSVLERFDVGVHDLTMNRATVAGKPALVATYAQDLVRDDGLPYTTFSTTYIFLGPSKQLDLVQFFRLDSVDDEFEQMTRTMNKSIQYVR